MTQIARTSLVDEIEGLQRGTTLDNREKQELYDQIDYALATLDLAIANVAAGSLAPGSVTNALLAGGITADKLVETDLIIAESQVSGLGADLALKANLASPALTGTPTAPTAAPGTNTTQLATTAFVAAATGTATDTGLTLSDITTNNVSTAKHGFAPKAPNDATKFLNGAGAWSVPSDPLKADLASPAFTGTPIAPTAAAATNTTQLATTAFVQQEKPTDATIVTTDVTTNNASTTKHGFAPKLPNDANLFLDGTGAWSVPPSGGGGGATDATLSFTDITTNNVGTTKHGFAPKAPNDATKFLDGTGAWSIPTEALTLTDVTTNNVSTTKHGFAPKAPNDATKFLDGTGAWSSPTDAAIATSDVTTNNVSTTKHGFAPKAPNDATKYMDGTAAWSVPSHALLDGAGTSDSLAGTVVRGDVIIGNSTPKWARLAKGAANTYLRSDGTDIAWAGVSRTAPAALTDTGTVNNWAPTGLSGSTFFEWSGASDLTVTGITAGAAGQVITFRNTGTKVLYFAHASASSSSANRLSNIAPGTMPIAPGGTAEFIYGAAGVWEMTQHAQGAWIDIAFAGGNFTANGGGSWTVDSGDVGVYRYLKVGRLMHVNCMLNTTTVSGTVTSLQAVGLPSASVQASQTTGVLYDNSTGAAVPALVNCPAGGSGFLISRLDGANLAAATNNTYLRFVTVVDW